VTTRIWHQAYPSNIAPHLEYPSATLHQLLALRAQSNPHRAALVYRQWSLDYAELAASVAALAAALQSMGVQKGDRVALYMPNCPPMVIGYFAVWQIGGVAVPVHPAYVAREFQQQVQDAGARVVICLDSLWERVAESAPASGLRHAIVARADESAAPSQAAPVAPEGVSVHRWSDLMAVPGATPAPVAVAPDDTAALLYTGGTTGVPKGARLTHRNLVTNAVQIAAWLADLVEGEEIVLTALPLTHSYSLTMCMNQAVLRGYTQVLIPNARQLDDLLSAIDTHRATLFAGVPSLFQAINQHSGCARRRVSPHLDQGVHQRRGAAAGGGAERVPAHHRRPAG
jgi:long-chain acyl-CoA synthetase